MSEIAKTEESSSATLEDARDAAWALLAAVTSGSGWAYGRSDAELRALARLRFILERL